MKQIVITISVLYFFQLFWWVLDITTPKFARFMWNKRQALLNLIPLYWVIELAKVCIERFEELEK